MIFLDFLWKFIVYIRLFLKKEHPLRYKERFAITDKENNTKLPLIWFHCVSVGEMNSVLCIIEEILKTKSYFILLTTTTIASAEIAENLNYKNFLHQFNTCDSPNFLRKFLSHWKPIKLIICESEFWPFMINEASKVSKLYLINSRLSEKSAKRWKLFGNYFKNILLKFEVIFPASLEGKNIFLDFKSNNISNIICNTKFTSDNIIKEKIKADVDKITKIDRRFKENNKITIGSFHLPDLMEIKNEIKKLIEFDRNIKFFLLPRHIDKSEDFQKELKKMNLDSVIINNENSLLNSENLPNIIIIKKVNILHVFYSISNICIIGGSFSFSTNGCHNPLESLFLDKITVIGQNNKNIRKTMPDLFKENILKIINAKDFYEEIKKIIALNQNNSNINEAINKIIIDNLENKNIMLEKILKL